MPIDFTSELSQLHADTPPQQGQPAAPPVIDFGQELQDLHKPPIQATPPQPTTAAEKPTGVSDLLKPLIVQPGHRFTALGEDLLNTSLDLARKIPGEQALERFYAKPVGHGIGDPSQITPEARKAAEAHGYKLPTTPYTWGDLIGDVSMVVPVPALPAVRGAIRASEVFTVGARGATTLEEASAVEAAHTAAAAARAAGAAETPASQIMSAYNQLLPIVSGEEGGFNAGQAIQAMNRARSVAGKASTMQEHMILMDLDAEQARTMGRQTLTNPVARDIEKLPAEQQREIRHYLEDRTAPIAPKYQDFVHAELDPYVDDLNRMFQKFQKTDPAVLEELGVSDERFLPRMNKEWELPFTRRQGKLARTTASLKPLTYMRAVSEEAAPMTVAVSDGRIVQHFGPGKTPELLATYERTPRVGQTFEAGGQTWTLERGTQKEIEAALGKNIYYENPVPVLIDRWQKMRQAEQALDFFEGLKVDPMWKTVALNAAETKPGVIPEHYVPTNSPYFRNWVMEPKVAAVLDLYTGDRMFGSMGDLNALNRALVTSIFVNPFAHTWNLLMDWGVEGAYRKLLQPQKAAIAFGRALKDVLTEGPRYRQLMRMGMPGSYTRFRNGMFYDAQFRRMAAELKSDPVAAQKLAQTLKTDMATAVNFPITVSNYFSWWLDDLLRLQAVHELELWGWKSAKAVEEVNKFLPDYRKTAFINVPDWTVGGMTFSTTPAKLLNTPLLSMFQAFHNGILRGLRNMILTPGRDLASLGRAGARLSTLGFAYFVAQPYLNHMLQKITGNPRLSLRPAGYLRPLETVRRVLAGQEDPAQALWTVYTPSPVLSSAMVAMTTLDPYTRKSVVHAAASPAQWLEQYSQGIITSAVGPVRDYERATLRQNVWPILAGWGGFSDPKLLPSEGAFIYRGRDIMADTRSQMLKAVQAGDFNKAMEIRNSSERELIGLAQNMLRDARDRGLGDGLFSTLDDTGIDGWARLLVLQMKLPYPGDLVSSPAPEIIQEVPWLQKLLMQKGKK